LSFALLPALLVFSETRCWAESEDRESPRVDNVPVFSMKLAYQTSVATLHQVGLLQNGVSLALGAQRQHFAFYVLAEAEGGDTSRGLGTNHESLGSELQWRVLPFWRVGGGAYLERLEIHRITMSTTLVGVGFGAFLSTELDVYRFGPRDDHAVFLGVRASDDGLGEQALLEARALLGFRY
jgi:hypothetical protein